MEPSITKINAQKTSSNLSSGSFSVPGIADENQAQELLKLFHQAVNNQLSPELREENFIQLMAFCRHESADQRESSKKAVSQFLTAHGDNLLTIAVKEWRLGWVNDLKDNRNLCLQVDAYGNTPLHIAAKSGSLESFFSLLTVLNLKTLNQNGESAIHVAISHGQQDIIRGLLERKLLKADTVIFTTANGLNLNPLAYAIMKGQREIVDLLLQSHLFEKEQWTPGLGNLLHVAAYFGCVDTCKSLLETLPKSSKLPIVQENEHGQTPLHVAASQGHPEILLLLHDKSPRAIETADKMGRRPIQAAAFAWQTSCVELLVTLGCKAEYFRAALSSLGADQSPEAQTMVHFMENLLPVLNDPVRRTHCAIHPIRWLALAGGGAKGPGEIGVLKAMKRQGYEVEGVSGTSIGSILSTLFAVGYSPEELETLFIEKSFKDFLDHPLKGKKISDILPINPSVKSLFTACNELRKFVFSPIQYGVSKAKGVVDKLVHTTGLCKGEALREWIEELIYQKTKIHYLTFGELADRTLGDLPHIKTCHLFVSITAIKDSSPELICMNTVDPEWRNHIISDGARSSASYPGAFEAHGEYIKSNGQRVQIPGSRHLDGGMLSNNATLPLDEVRFIKPVQGEEGRRPEFNRSVIAASFQAPGTAEEDLKEDFTIFDLIQGIIDTYMSAEQILNSNPYYETRSIKVPVDVGTMSFPSEEKKREMISNGEQVTTDFLHKRDEHVRAIQKSTSISSPVLRTLQQPQYLVQPTHPQFTRRANYLARLETILVPDPTNWVRDQPCREVLLYGPEGIGKTELVKAFGNRHFANFSLIWTIECQSPEQRRKSYSLLANALSIPNSSDEELENLTSKVHYALDNLSQPWLLIFDGIESLPSRPKQGSVLLTSRSYIEHPRLTAAMEVNSFQIDDTQNVELVDPNVKDDNALPLETVNKLNSHQILPKYVDKKYKIGITNDNTLMHKAASAGRVDILRETAVLYPELVSQLNSWGQTPLHSAAKAGHLSAVDFLLSTTSQLNAKDSNLNTPLHLAVIEGKMDIVLTLVDSGGNLLELNNNHENSLHLCVSRKYVELFEWMLSKVQSDMAFSTQIFDQKDGTGETVTFKAVPHPEILRLLLETGVYPDVPNTFGYTPLHWAARNNHLESAVLLLDHGANKDALNQNGQIPLHLACLNGHTALAHILISREYNALFAKHEQSRPQLIGDPINYYLRLFQDAYERGANLEQLLFLEKAGTHLLLQKNYTKAAHYFNSALKIAQNHQLGHQYEYYLMANLEKLEGEMVLDLFQERVGDKFFGHLRRHQELLSTIKQVTREKIESGEKGGVIQAELTQKLNRLLRNLIEEAIEQASIQETLPPFAIIGFGATGRQEIDLNSRLEFAILVQNPNPELKAQLQKLVKLIQIKMINLGETPFEILRPEAVGGVTQSSIIQGGIRILEGDTNPLNPVLEDMLINSPLQLASIQDKTYLEQNPTMLNLANQLLTYDLILGDNALCQNYKKEISNKIHKGLFKWTSTNEQRGASIFENNKTSQSSRNSDEFNIEDDFYIPFHTMIESFAIYNKLEGKSTIQRLLELKLSKEDTAFLIGAFEKILLLKIQQSLSITTDQPETSQMGDTEDYTILRKTILALQEAADALYTSKKAIKGLTLGG